MEYIKLIVLLLLVIGVTSAASTNAKSLHTKSDDYGDYAGDDDYVYDDDVPAAVENKVQTNEIDTTSSPPYFSHNVINVTASIGDDVILSCDAKNIQANNIIIWYNRTQMISQHHIVLSQRSRVAIFQNFSLKISNIDEHDINTYSCEILPQKITQLINLSIAKSSLTITSEDADVTNRQLTKIEGDKIVFTCAMPGAKDNGKTKIRWSKRGKRIDSGINGINIKDGTVTIETIEHHHHGLYQCLADGGEESPPHASLNLNVKYRPRMGIKRHYVNAAYGDRAEMYCTYHANPGDVTIFWAKEGTSLPSKGRKYTTKNNENMDLYGANHTVLYVDKVDALDYGEYECVARNALGEGSGIIHLIQEPEPPRFENMTITGRRASLTWIARSKQLLSEAVLDYRLHGSDRWMTESITTPQLHNTGFWKIEHSVELSPGKWHVRIKTKNIGGWSRFSNDHEIDIHNGTQLMATDEIDGSKPIKEELRSMKDWNYADDVQIASFGGSGGSNNANQENTLPLIILIVPVTLLRIKAIMSM